MTTFQGPVAVAAPQASPAKIEQLQLREIDLRAQLARLEGQRPILERQMRTASNGGLRVVAEQELLQTDLQMAATRAELTSVRELIALNGGRAFTRPGGDRANTVQPASPTRTRLIDKVDPDAITAVFLMTTLALVVPLSVGLTRRLWRRPPAKDAPTGAAMDALNARFDRLEQAVDAVAIEVERVSESQRFVAKVLTERPSHPNVAPEADAALGEAKPFLALGAGPIEAIPVVQRQAVKQSITPH